MNENRYETEKGVSAGDMSNAQRGIDRLDMIFRSMLAANNDQGSTSGTSNAQTEMDPRLASLRRAIPSSSDQQLPHEQRVFSGDEQRVERGMERLHQLLQRNDQTTTNDVQEQNLPYGDIFRQNYDQTPAHERLQLRAQEQGKIREIAVSEILDSPDIRGAKDFHHHISYEDAKLHTQQLNDVVLPWVRAGAVGNDFQALDQSLGRTDNGYFNTYRLFYGNSPVTVGQCADGRFALEGGRHRAYMAKELGLKYLPVKISGK